MDTTGRTIWQQAAGDTNRNYVDICLQYGVVLNGPGSDGPWPDSEAKSKARGISSRKLSDLRRFAEEVKDGDIIVLRTGTSEVRGVGQVVGPYQWSDAFEDLDGWDLQHVRRVRWLWHANGDAKLFETYDLKLGDTTQRLGKGSVAAWVESLAIDEKMLISPLASMPDAEQQAVTVQAISEFLFDQGVASSAISALVSEFGELTRIAKWYKRYGMPSEHETVAYLVVPLLRALGWTPQRMAVEWNRVDVALFSALPRSDETLRVVVEAKKMDDACLTAASQAMSYAATRPQCHRLIVTDGMRYGVHARTGSEPFRLIAYMNLARLRHHYSIYQCGGVEDALLAMSPDWNSSRSKQSVHPPELRDS